MDLGKRICPLPLLQVVNVHPWRKPLCEVRGLIKTSRHFLIHLFSLSYFHLYFHSSPGRGGVGLIHFLLAGRKHSTFIMLVGLLYLVHSRVPSSRRGGCKALARPWGSKREGGYWFLNRLVAPSPWDNCIIHTLPRIIHAH